MIPLFLIIQILGHLQDYEYNTVFWIRIHWIRIRIQGIDDQKLKKKYSWKNKLYFWSKIAVYLTLGHLKGTVSQDGFGFWKHVWLVLGLYRAQGHF